MFKNLVIIFSLVLIAFLIFTLREYLVDKNEIEAEIGRANCIIKKKQANMAFTGDFCDDIKYYKLNFSGGIK